MKKHIKKLRERPEEERKKLAIIFAIGVTVVIVIMWLIIILFIEPDKNKKNKGFDIFKKELSEINKDIPKIGAMLKFNGEENQLKNPTTPIEYAEVGEIETENNSDKDIEILE